MRSKKAWQSKNWVSWNSCRGKDGDIASKIISPRYSSPRADLETQNKRIVLPLMFFILASFLLSTNEKIYLQGQRHSPQTLLTALQYLELQFYNEHSRIFNYGGFHHSWGTESTYYAFLESVPGETQVTEGVVPPSLDAIHYVANLPCTFILPNSPQFAVFRLITSRKPSVQSNTDIYQRSLTLNFGTIL